MATMNDSASIFSQEDDSSLTCHPLGDDADDNYFSKSTDFLSLTSSREIELAIEKCKEDIIALDEMTDEKRQLVQRLVQLRLRLQEVQDVEIYGLRDCKLIQGHHFELQHLTSVRLTPVKIYCETCCSLVWIFIQSWLKCSVCGYITHSRCIDFLKRTCPGVRASENPKLIMEICPERGLLAQNYCCAECKAPVSFRKNTDCVPQLCDYSGLYFCSSCHWGDTNVIPARIVFNWDFEKRPVSRYCKQLLRVLGSKAILDVEALNPQLFNYVDELALIRGLRKDIMIMKQYMMTCKQALENKLLMHLSGRQHFVESSDFYSLKDLVDLHNGELQAYLQPINARFAQHITEDCEVCKGKGHVCRLCNRPPTVFAFQVTAASCGSCSAVFHRECFTKRREALCPKCEAKLS